MERGRPSLLRSLSQDRRASLPSRRGRRRRCLRQSLWSVRQRSDQRRRQRAQAGRRGPVQAAGPLRRARGLHDRRHRRRRREKSPRVKGRSQRDTGGSRTEASERMRASRPLSRRKRPTETATAGTRVGRRAVDLHMHRSEVLQTAAEAAIDLTSRESSARAGVSAPDALHSPSRALDGVEIRYA